MNESVTPDDDNVLATAILGRPASIRGASLLSTGDRMDVKIFSARQARTV